MSLENRSVGGKAASLIKLSKAGFQVPDFFVIPCEVYQEAKHQKFQSIPYSFEPELQKMIEKFQGSPLAIRSSANKEDGEKNSFAGLFESFLNVSGADQVKDAIKCCWISTSTERTRKYCDKNSIAHDDLNMAVILQKYIDPDIAGVVFTVNAITGNDSEMIVEACAGSGEKLVSGEINPSRFVLRSFGPEVIVSGDDRLSLSPSKEILKELRDQCVKIQALYGRPQDVEFAIKNDKVYILQSRDITKIQFSKEVGEWTTSDFRDGGVSSAVVSPVMWSLYEKIFASSLPEYFIKLKLITREKAQQISWYRVFYGRPYWNLRAVKDIQETLPGYNERNFDKDMALPINYEGNGVVTPFSLKGLLKGISVLNALHKEYAQQKKRSEKIIAEFHQIENVYRNKSVADLSDIELKRSFIHLVNQDFTYVESEYFQTIYNASNARMELSDRLKAYIKVDPSIEYVNLISNLENLEVTGPGRHLETLAKEYAREEPQALSKIEKILSSKLDPITLDDLEGETILHGQLSSFVKKYYFHGERELDLLIPRWGEDLRFVLETLKNLLTTSSLSVASSAKINFYQIELEKLKKAHLRTWGRWMPGAWSTVLDKLERVRHFLWLREEVRDRSTRVYYFIRQHLKEIGKRTGLDDLVFYLSYQQILSFCEESITSDELKVIAQEIKSYANGFRQFKNANEIGFRFNNASWAARSSQTNGKTSYFGIGCSSGIVRGKACVIKNISEASRLKQGDIMIVPFTDPGWTPMFSLASAVVTEAGGLLSHAALISREYGIPCVLNLNSATDLILDGASIEIDGSEGRVTLL